MIKIKQDIQDFHIKTNGRWAPIYSDLYSKHINTIEGESNALSQATPRQLKLFVKMLNRFNSPRMEDLDNIVKYMDSDGNFYESGEMAGARKMKHVLSYGEDFQKYMSFHDYKAGKMDVLLKYEDPRTGKPTQAALFSPLSQMELIRRDLYEVETSQSTINTELDNFVDRVDLPLSNPVNPKSYVEIDQDEEYSSAVEAAFQKSILNLWVNQIGYQRFIKLELETLKG